MRINPLPIYLVTLVSTSDHTSSTIITSGGFAWAPETTFYTLSGSFCDKYIEREGEGQREMEGERQRERKRPRQRQ